FAAGRRAHELWTEKFASIEKPTLDDLELLAQLKLELASLVESDDAQNGWEEKTIRVELPDGKVEEYQDRVATWPHKAEVIKLYDEAEALFARSANLGADRETVLHGGLAIFRKAMFFCHMAQMGQFNFGPGGPGADDRVRTTLPVVDNPLPVLREVITKYPDSRRAPEAWYTIATIYRQLGEYVRCLEELKKLREVYPKSKWVSDAMGVEQSITMPRMETSAQTSVAPGEVLKFSVNSRNVKEIQYVAHAFDLAALMNDAAFLADAAVHVDNLDSLQKGGYVERFRGEEIGKWSVDTKDDGTHQWYANGEVVANVKADRLGAFIVTATAGNITSMSLHVRSDRVAVVRPEPTGVVFWLVDRETGEPMDQGKWRYKEYFSWWINRQTFTATTTQQMTGDDAGVCRRALTVPGNLPPQARTRGVTAFAVSADGHMALTNTANPRSWFSDWNPHTRWLTWTERPVYRPGQDVHFKGIIRNYSAGDYSNVAGRELQWEAVDPRNQKVSSGTFTTSPVGTFNASLTLGARPTLGWYRVRVKQPASRGWEQQFTFRVEEYKKPEFEVSIESGSDRIKLGKDGQAKVAVKYYSGEPVSGAKASWRVYHEIVWNRFRFQRDYDWFYGQYLYEDQERGWGRDVVANGETECDANGEFTITFPTTHAAENWPDYKHRYSIEVEATDESRRVINGAGSVLVTKRAVEVFVDTKRGLYAPGDKVEFELHAETPAGKPVALDGKLHIGRLDVYWTTEKDKDGNEIRVRKRDEKWFTSLDVKTDAEGRGFAFFTMDSAGQFCVKFEATDPDGEACTDTHDLLVAGEGDALPDVRFSDLQIVPDQRVHSVGQTARVALTAVEPGTTILYRVETGADEAPCEVHQLNGAALIFNIPITKRLQPNYFITAIAIRHGAMQQARMEMFVLPVEKLLDVSVEANAEEFLPGSEGNLKLTVKDHDGKVVEGAEAAIAVVDASLYSIAPDNTPDPRTYYWQRRRSLGWNVYTSLTFNSSGYRADTNEYRTYENHGFAEGWSLSYGGWIHHDWQMRSRNLSGPAPEMGYKPVSKESARHGEQFMKPATRGGDADSGGFANRALFGTARFKNLDSLEEQLSGGMRSFGGEGGGRGGQPGNSWGDGGPDAENAPMDHNAEPDAPSGGAAHDGKAGQPAQQGGPGGGPAPMANPTVRTEFKDLALWAAQLTTSADGTVGTKVQWPDNLTRWKVNCVIVDSQSRMGYATISLRTTKNVKVRLQAPRFFVESDEVVLTAVVQNDLKVAKDVRVKLAISEQLELLPGGTAEVTLRLPAHGRDRVDWRVKVVKAGIAKVRMDALTDVESDAQEMTFPAYIHGATKHHIVTGRIDAGNPQSEAEVSFTLPAGIDATRTKLRVSVTPSVVNTALDALPYLIDYPYGCVEQTMSRFMPAVAVRKTLADLGVNLEDVAKRRNNINLSAWPVEAQVEYRSSAVFNQARLNDIIAVGLARIYDFQMADGGFGWWKGGNSDIYMTAYVLQGLLVARQAEVKIDENVLARGLAFLSANFSK
ncbi:MAG: MG2 domain-containing protein, partial [Planctomycetota bacterium]